MDKKSETDLFEYLARHPKVADWAKSQLDEQIKVLMQNPSHEAILKAQGAAAVYKLMLDKLVAAKAALSR